MMVTYIQNPLKRRLEELQQEDDDDIDKNETPDPTHECQVCGYLEKVDDHQKHTPNWCDSCESVQTFRKLEQNS